MVRIPRSKCILPRVFSTVVWTVKIGFTHCASGDLFQTSCKFHWIFGWRRSRWGFAQWGSASIWRMWILFPLLSASQNSKCLPSASSCTVAAQQLSLQASRATAVGASSVFLPSALKEGEESRSANESHRIGSLFSVLDAIFAYYDGGVLFFSRPACSQKDWGLAIESKVCKCRNSISCEKISEMPRF